MSIYNSNLPVHVNFGCFPLSNSTSYLDVIQNKKQPVPQNLAELAVYFLEGRKYACMNQLKADIALFAKTDVNELCQQIIYVINVLERENRNNGIRYYFMIQLGFLLLDGSHDELFKSICGKIENIIFIKKNFSFNLEVELYRLVAHMSANLYRSSNAQIINCFFGKTLQFEVWLHKGDKKLCLLMPYGLAEHEKRVHNELGKIKDTVKFYAQINMLLPRGSYSPPYNYLLEQSTGISFEILNQRLSDENSQLIPLAFIIFICEYAAKPSEALLELLISNRKALLALEKSSHKDIFEVYFAKLFEDHPAKKQIIFLLFQASKTSSDGYLYSMEKTGEPQLVRIAKRLESLFLIEKVNDFALLTSEEKTKTISQLAGKDSNFRKPLLIKIWEEQRSGLSKEDQLKLFEMLFKDLQKPGTAKHLKEIFLQAVTLEPNLWYSKYYVLARCLEEAGLIDELLDLCTSPLNDNMPTNTQPQRYALLKSFFYVSLENDCIDSAIDKLKKLFDVTQKNPSRIDEFVICLRDLLKKLAEKQDKRILSDVVVQMIRFLPPSEFSDAVELVCSQTIFLVEANKPSVIRLMKDKYSLLVKQHHLRSLFTILTFITDANLKNIEKSLYHELKTHFSNLLRQRNIPMAFLSIVNAFLLSQVRSLIDVCPILKEDNEAIVNMLEIAITNSHLSINELKWIHYLAESSRDTLKLLPPEIRARLLQICIKILPLILKSENPDVTDCIKLVCKLIEIDVNLTSNKTHLLTIFNLIYSKFPLEALIILTHIPVEAREKEKVKAIFRLLLQQQLQIPSTLRDIALASLPMLSEDTGASIFDNLLTTSENQEEKKKCFDFFIDNVTTFSFSEESALLLLSEVKTLGQCYKILFSLESFFNRKSVRFPQAFVKHTVSLVTVKNYSSEVKKMVDFLQRSQNAEVKFLIFNFVAHFLFMEHYFFKNISLDLVISNKEILKDKLSWLVLRFINSIKNIDKTDFPKYISSLVKIINSPNIGLNELIPFLEAVKTRGEGYELTVPTVVRCMDLLVNVEIEDKHKRLSEILKTYLSHFVHKKTHLGNVFVSEVGQILSHPLFKKVELLPYYANMCTEVFVVANQRYPLERKKIDYNIAESQYRYFQFTEKHFDVLFGTTGVYKDLIKVILYPLSTDQYHFALQRFISLYSKFKELSKKMDNERLTILQLCSHLISVMSSSENKQDRHFTFFTSVVEVFFNDLSDEQATKVFLQSCELLNRNKYFRRAFWFEQIAERRGLLPEGYKRTVLETPLSETELLEQEGTEEEYYSPQGSGLVRSPALTNIAALAGKPKPISWEQKIKNLASRLDTDDLTTQVQEIIDGFSKAFFSIETEKLCTNLKVLFNFFDSHLNEEKYAKQFATLCDIIVKDFTSSFVALNKAKIVYFTHLYKVYFLFESYYLQAIQKGFKGHSMEKKVNTMLFLIEKYNSLRESKFYKKANFEENKLSLMRFITTSVDLAISAQTDEDIRCVEVYITTLNTVSFPRLKPTKEECGDFTMENLAFICQQVYQVLSLPLKTSLSALYTYLRMLEQKK